MAIERRAAVFVRYYLRPSMTFIHDEIRFHERWSIDVFAERLMNLDRFPGVPVHAVRPCGPVEWARYKLTRCTPGFDREFESGGFSIVHAHFGPMGAYALAYKERFHVPLVVTFHGADVPALASPERFKPTRWRYRLGWKRLVSGADMFLAASTELRDMLIDLGARPERTLVHRLGVDLARFTPVAPPSAPPLRVLMVGRLVPKKGFDDGLRALSLVREDMVATIIGDGPERGRLELIARQAGVASRVAFRGVVTHDEVLRAMRDHHVVLAPSAVGPGGDRESGLIVLKEAGACARPAVATRHGGIPEILVDGETGFMLPEHDVEGLADRIGMLARDGDLRARMGAAARDRMERKYDQRVRVAALEDVYDDLVRGRAGAS